MQNKTRVKEELEKWADRCLGLAKTKHKEVTSGKALTDFDLQSLVAIKTRLTAAWSKQSVQGQAAVIIIGLCAEFCYQCLAHGYDLRSSSDTLQSTINQATEDMVHSEKHKVRTVDRLHLDKLLTRFKSLQPGWQKEAQSR